jgi:hypothetical protein
MLLQAFALFHQLQQTVLLFLTHAKKACRTVLGPEVPNFYILRNGDVVPTYFSNIEDQLSTAHIYDVETQRISNALIPMEGRYKPLTILALCITLPNGKKVDLSEWVGNIRANPNIPLAPKTLIDLWSASTNTYVRYQTVEVTDNLGDVHTVTYNG